MPPPLLNLADEAAYRAHFINSYCRAAIYTHDGIRVFFRQDVFSHAFFESSLRNGLKDTFSNIRAERMDWIATTLSDPAAARYQGWVTQKRAYDPARRVDFIYEDFVVVLGLRLNQQRQLVANFMTCYQANNSISKIRSSPLWTQADCLNALT